MATTVKGAGARNAHLCNFKDLPQVEGQPHGCAWGVYPSRQDGSGPDELGRAAFSAYPASVAACLN